MRAGASTCHVPHWWCSPGSWCPTGCARSGSTCSRAACMWQCCKATTPAAARSPLSGQTPAASWRQPWMERLTMKVRLQLSAKPRSVLCPGVHLGVAGSEFQPLCIAEQSLQDVCLTAGAHPTLSLSDGAWTAVGSSCCASAATFVSSSVLMLLTISVWQVPRVLVCCMFWAAAGSDWLLVLQVDLLGCSGLKQL